MKPKRKEELIKLMHQLATNTDNRTHRAAFGEIAVQLEQSVAEDMMPSREVFEFRLKNIYEILKQLRHNVTVMETKRNGVDPRPPTGEDYLDLLDLTTRAYTAALKHIHRSDYAELT